VSADFHQLRSVFESVSPRLEELFVHSQVLINSLPHCLLHDWQYGYIFAVPATLLRLWPSSGAQILNIRSAATMCHVRIQYFLYYKHIDARFVPCGDSKVHDDTTEYAELHSFEGPVRHASWKHTTCFWRTRAPSEVEQSPPGTGGTWSTTSSRPRRRS
jgi:hypothetical protein